MSRPIIPLMKTDKKYHSSIQTLLDECSAVECYYKLPEYFSVDLQVAKYLLKSHILISGSGRRKSAERLERLLDGYCDHLQEIIDNIGK